MYLESLLSSYGGSYLLASYKLDLSVGLMFGVS